MKYFEIDQIEIGVWRLSSVRSILPNALEHLLRSLAPIMTLDTIQKIVCDLELVAAMKAIGLNLECYNDQSAIFSTKSLPSHPIEHDSQEYIEYCRIRESYMYGITTTAKAAFYPGSVANGSEWRDYSARKVDHFSELAKTRRSAKKFRTDGIVSKSTIEAILQDCFYDRNDGHLQYASAGSFRSIDLYLHCSKVAECEPGSYYVNGSNRNWSAYQSHFSNDILYPIGFEQEWIKGVSFWLAPVVCFEETLKKYGARAYRFGLMTAGAISAQAVTSGTSFGLQSRILGGFDDSAASLLCGISNSPSKMVSAFIGFGYESLDQ